MSSSNHSPPHNNQDDSYYGPPPGGYTPSPHQQARGTREAPNYDGEFRSEDAYRYEDSQQNYGGYQDPHDPSYRYSSSSYHPRDEFGRSRPPAYPSERSRHEYPPIHHQHGLADTHHRPSDNNNRGQWNNKYVRPRTPEPPRNVRSRTASLTEEEEGEAPTNGGSSRSHAQSTAAVPAAEESEDDLFDVESDDDEPKPPADPTNNETASSLDAIQSTSPVCSTVASRPTADEQDTSRVSEEESEQPTQVVSSASLVASAPVQQPSAGSNDAPACPFFYHETKGDPMAFCCADCKCSDEDREKFGGGLAYAQKNGSPDYKHRHCCHRITATEVDPNWLPPFREAQERIAECDDGASYPKPKPDIISQRQVTVNVNKQTQVKNDEQIAHPLSLLSTNPAYIKNQKQFNDAVSKVSKESLRPAVVLDVFAGVGAALVVLKRLKIAMKTVIHVEHDRIASHVVQYHHDKEINPDAAEDGIKHVYMSKFEELESNIDQIINDHGPIDIIVGGPPCTDYSGINANAQGPEGEQGQFLMRFADFIRNVQTKQPGHQVYYLVENVVFTDKNGLEYYNMVQGKLGAVETVQDALYFSPCVRKRSYWLNVPLTDCEHGYDEAVRIKPSSCMEEGWKFPGEDRSEFAKVATFLASKGRLDDEPRMIKIKQVGNSKKYKKSHFSALERGRMMGFPEAYVQRGVEHLFTELLTNGLEPYPAKKWKDVLDPRYWCYSGEPFKCEHYYDEEIAWPRIGLRMSPPQVTKDPYFFNAEDYSKHLIGNSFSIPVVEYLLTRLTEVFATREYEGFDYKYRWETEE